MRLSAYGGFLEVFWTKQEDKKLKFDIIKITLWKSIYENNNRLKWDIIKYINFNQNKRLKVLSSLYSILKRS